MGTGIKDKQFKFAVHFMDNRILVKAVSHFSPPENPGLCMEKVL